ncbi:MAG: HD domain-containing phosphohydrolase [Thermodesulfobacteriota bacterium]
MKKPFRCRLALAIGLIISMLLTALGVTTTLYTYDSQKKKTMESTERIFGLSSRYTEEKLSGLLHSVKSFVTVSSVLESLGSSEKKNLDILLPYFKQSFLAIPWMQSFYVGHPDGSFYMIQAIENDGAAIKAEAPAKAAYRIKSITHDVDGQRRMFFHYYDADLSFLKTQEVAHDGYDPRKRGWYQEASKTERVVITNPYIFFSSGEIGITAAHSLSDQGGVVGADSVLTDLARLLGEQKLTPSTQIVITDPAGQVIFSTDENDLAKIKKTEEGKGKEGLQLQELKNQVPYIIDQQVDSRGLEEGQLVDVNGKEWYGHMRKLVGDDGKGIYLFISAPIDELMVNAKATRRRNLLILLTALLIAVGLGFYFSRRISGSLQELSVQAESVRDFQLSNPLTVHSKICEVDDLAASMTVMQSAINRFVEIARALSAEKEMETVLELIVDEARAVTGADGGGIGLVSDDEKYFSHVLVKNGMTDIHLGGCSECAVSTSRLSLAVDPDEDELLEAAVVRLGKTRSIEEVSSTHPAESADIRSLHERGEYRCHSLLVIPLLNRQDEVIGLLHLVNARDTESGEIVPFPEHKITYVEALSSNAALALDNNRLIRAQKELFDSFVRLIAGAIDTKSPYTGGHCQRVPVIAEMLGDAASSAKRGVFSDFHLSEDERYELFVASWLHDCGKVTTPEYVVDKATKLETIYNRIHEVRTRFEVLWRDADIAYYRALLENPGDEVLSGEKRDRRREKLREDYAFVAQCNVGGEFMDPEHVGRLQEIGQQSWERYFDNRLGLSADEEARMDKESETSFPVRETLLADREEHIVPRLDGGNPYGDNPWHIVMEVPEYSYNHGELYNLSIAKGTLTEEERYKINDHIVQTIDMLNKLPFPKEIMRVPDWAGNHHEKLDGSGYPRALNAEQLSTPERIMALADIFEALTAADRPYKTAKSLNTCIRIMSHMRDDGHICSDLFELFLTSGIYQQYAEQYMQPEQMDKVDVASYLKMV